MRVAALPWLPLSWLQAVTVTAAGAAAATVLATAIVVVAADAVAVAAHAGSTFGGSYLVPAAENVTATAAVCYRCCLLLPLSLMFATVVP